MTAIRLAGAGPLHEYAEATPKIQFGLLVLLIGMLVVGAWTALSGRDVLGPALAFLPLALGWFNLDDHIEGRILVAFSAAHGIDEADLAPLVIAVLAAGAWYLTNSGAGLAVGPRHRL